MQDIAGQGRALRGVPPLAMTCVALSGIGVRAHQARRRRQDRQRAIDGTATERGETVWRLPVETVSACAGCPGMDDNTGTERSVEVAARLVAEQLTRVERQRRIARGSGSWRPSSSGAARTIDIAAYNRSVAAVENQSQTSRAARLPGTSRRGRDGSSLARLSVVIGARLLLVLRNGCVGVQGRKTFRAARMNVDNRRQAAGVEDLPHLRVDPA